MAVLIVRNIDAGIVQVLECYRVLDEVERQFGGAGQ